MKKTHLERKPRSIIFRTLAGLIGCFLFFSAALLLRNDTDNWLQFITFIFIALIFIGYSITGKSLVK